MLPNLQVGGQTGHISFTNENRGTVVLGLYKGIWLHKDSGPRDLTAAESLVRPIVLVRGSEETMKTGGGISWPDEEVISKTWSVSLPNLPEAASSLQTIEGHFPLLLGTHLHKKRQSTGSQEDSELVLRTHTYLMTRCFSEWPQRTHQGPQSSQHSQRAVSELSRDFKAGLSLFRACVSPHGTVPMPHNPHQRGNGSFPSQFPGASHMAESSNFGLCVLPEGPRALLIQSNIPESSLNFSPCSLESPKAPAGAWLEH